MRFVERFNATYDFLARLVKLCVLVAALALLSWWWPYIDWRRTGSELVAKRTPFQLAQPAPEAPPASSQPLTPGRSRPGSPPAAQSTPAGPASSAAQPTPPRPARSERDYLNIYQFGQLVFTTDKLYEITSDTLEFDKLLLKGRPDYEKTFVYAGVEIRIMHINEYIGLLVSGGAVEGPVLRGVRCAVVRR